MNRLRYSLPLLILPCIAGTLTAGAWIRNPMHRYPPAKKPAAAVPFLPAGSRIHMDQVYATTDCGNLKLDLYLPPRSPNPQPSLIWIHGGSWNGGSKGDDRFPLNLVKHGFAVADIDYRLSSEAPFPAQIIDCRRAVRWLRRHSESYGLDPDRIGVFGFSAGGHLAALLGTAEEVDTFGTDDDPTISTRVQAVCTIAAPTDMPALAETASWGARMTFRQLIGGDPKTEPYRSVAATVSPINYVSGNEPSFLILHGSKDHTVPPSQSERLHRALKLNQIDSTLLIVEGAKHELPLTSGNFTAEEMEHAISAFFKRALR